MADHKIIMHRGDSYPLQLTLTNSSTNSAIPLSGCSFIMTVNEDAAPVDNSNRVFQVIGLISDPSSGIVTFTPSAANTDITPKKYYYDIQMTDNAGNIRTVVKSSFTITMDITK